MRLRKILQRTVIPVAVCLFGFVSFAAVVPAHASAAPLPRTFAAGACKNVTDQSQEHADDGQGQNCLFSQYINPFVKLLAGLAGLVFVVSIIWGGIMYQTSADDPGRVAAAKGHIYQALIALFTFLFLIAFLNWLLPGGAKG